MTVFNRMAAILVLVVAFLAGTTWKSDSMENNSTEQQKFVFQFDELESKRLTSSRSYLPFLNVDSMHCGIYTLKAGEKDGQQPHKEDEVYFVQQGSATINIIGKDYDVKEGSIIFVPAKAQHHFHSIKNDLKLLVFFSKGPTEKANGDQ